MIQLLHSLSVISAYRICPLTSGVISTIFFSKWLCVTQSWQINIFILDSTRSLQNDYSLEYIQFLWLRPKKKLEYFEIETNSCIVMKFEHFIAFSIKIRQQEKIRINFSYQIFAQMENRLFWTYTLGWRQSSFSTRHPSHGLLNDRQWMARF